jgi:hypothetical protein
MTGAGMSVASRPVTMSNGVKTGIDSNKMLGKTRPIQAGVLIATTNREKHNCDIEHSVRI